MVFIGGCFVYYNYNQDDLDLKEKNVTLSVLSQIKIYKYYGVYDSGGSNDQCNIATVLNIMYY